MKEKVKEKIGQIIDKTLEIGEQIRKYMIEDTIKDINKVLGEESTTQNKEGNDGKSN